MRHFRSTLDLGSKCLITLDNKSGGPDRDRTDDLLHAMQGSWNTVSNLSSNLVIFQLEKLKFIIFTSFTWFHESNGGNLGETPKTFPTFGELKLTLTIAYFGRKFKAISHYFHHIKTTSRHAFRGNYGKAIHRYAPLRQGMVQGTSPTS